MGYHEYLATLITSGLISVILALFFWHRRAAPGAMAMAGLTGMVSVLALGYIVEVMVETLSGFRLANAIEYIGIVTIPVLLFIFTLQYTGYDNWLPRYPLALFVVPVLTLVLVWTNYLHGWMWHDAHLDVFGDFIVQVKTYGPWFWVHTVYSYALIIAGIVIIGRSLFHPRRLYRIQAIALLAAIAMPVIWNVIYVFRAAPTYRLDMGPAAFVFSGLVIAVGLFRFRILDIIPIARGTVLENMRDGIIILDCQNRIVDLNRAAERIIGISASQVVGISASHGLIKLPDLLEYVEFKGKKPTEIVVGSGDTEFFYEPDFVSLYDRQTREIGVVITLHDVTDRKKMLHSLKEYASRITEVQEEERKRIAYELHDDTAQYLSILKLEIESLLQSGKIQSPDVLGKLGFLQKDAERAFNDVRRYSHELRPAALEYLGLQAALEQMAEDVNRMGQLAVEATTEGEDPGLSEEVKLGFFRIAQEAVNNSRKHSRASKVNIRLQFIEGLAKMSIVDNGSGFNVQDAGVRAGKKGSMGLMSMQERAGLIGARLRIESEPRRGTTVTVEINLGEITPI